MAATIATSCTALHSMPPQCSRRSLRTASVSPASRALSSASIRSRNQRRAENAWSGSLGLAKVIADPDAGWLSLGIAARYDSFTGLGAAATVELALRRLPIVVGARHEQEISKAREHAVLIELGGDLRRF